MAPRSKYTCANAVRPGPKGPGLRLLLCAALVVLAAVVRAQQPPAAISADAVRSAIERTLVSAPRGFETLLAPAQTGVRVVDVDVQVVAPGAERITIDLSQKTLTYDPSGNVEPLLDQVVTSTAALTAGRRHVEYRFLIDGLPLERFLSRVSPRAGSRASPGGGSRVVISAGHGWYWNDSVGGWRLQRDYFWGIAEDLVNWEMAHYVRDALRDTSFDTRPARHPDRDALQGVSGHPGWQEGATYFIRALGAPPAVWDIGVNDYARDINSRPLYANWIESALVISIHNNGGEGTGTETWFDTTNGQEAESERLATVINTHVVLAIRAHYNPAWPDRGLRSCNGCKGENRLAARPAVILEVAFMDTRSPDNEALHDDRFKQIVAEAIRDALHEWAEVGD